MTIRAQAPELERLRVAVEQACEGQVRVSVHELTILRRVIVTLTPARRGRGRAWRSRMLACASSAAAGQLPASVLAEVRWA